MAQTLNRHAITVMAVKLVQPGRLADVTEGVQRILPNTPDYSSLKSGVKDELEALREAGLVCLYHGQRYVLTDTGEQLSRESGIDYLIQARRMFLLKETRKANAKRRSGTRDGSLKQ